MRFKHYIAPFVLVAAFVCLAAYKPSVVDQLLTYRTDKTNAYGVPLCPLGAREAHPFRPCSSYCAVYSTAFTVK